MTKPQAAARRQSGVRAITPATMISAEIIRIVGSVERLNELFEWHRTIPFPVHLNMLTVATGQLSILLAKYAGKDPLAEMVKGWEAAAKREKNCPCDGKPVMDPRCARQGMCMVEDGDGD